MEINRQITADEISRFAKDLKIEKTCYDDNIINEYIKSSAHLLIPIYIKLFNCIFDSGKVFGTWLSGNIQKQGENLMIHKIIDQFRF